MSNLKRGSLIANPAHPVTNGHGINRHCGLCRPRTPLGRRQKSACRENPYHVQQVQPGRFPLWESILVYPVHVMTRKFLGEMTRKIAEVRPIARNLFAQETERRVGELRTSCVAFVVRNVSMHQAP
jgi:hypothetical protein